MYNSFTGVLCLKILIIHLITTLVTSQVQFHDDNSNSGALGGSMGRMDRGSGGGSKDWPVAKASRDSGGYQMDDPTALSA